MKLRRVLAPPNWSMPWFIGAALLGVLLPALLAAITMIAGYCPMGSALPRELPWGHFGVILLIFGMSAIILCAAPIYALLAWHWRPLALGAIFAVGAVVGFVPGTMAGNCRIGPSICSISEALGWLVPSRNMSS